MQILGSEALRNIPILFSKKKNHSDALPLAGLFFLCLSHSGPNLCATKGFPSTKERSMFVVSGNAASGLTPARRTAEQRIRQLLIPAVRPSASMKSPTAWPTTSCRVQTGTSQEAKNKTTL
jgi:hypothetical protein